MELPITLPMRAITARDNMTEGDVMAMWIVACTAVCVALLAYGWLAGMGVLAWL